MSRKKRAGNPAGLPISHTYSRQQAVASKACLGRARMQTYGKKIGRAEADHLDPNLSLTLHILYCSQSPVSQPASCGSLRVSVADRGRGSKEKSLACCALRKITTGTFPPCLCPHQPQSRAVVCRVYIFTTGYHVYAHTCWKVDAREWNLPVEGGEENVLRASCAKLGGTAESLSNLS